MVLLGLEQIGLFARIGRKLISLVNSMMSMRSLENYSRNDEYDYTSLFNKLYTNASNCFYI